MAEPIIEIKNLSTYLGDKRVLSDLSLTINTGESVAIIGPSGCGKTTLLRTILMLLKPHSGTIKLLGIESTRCSGAEERLIRRQWGVMFQSGALFSSLTVLDNILFPMREETKISKMLSRQVALFKIALVGLSQEDAMKYPSELSGGMRKLVALARALALDPRIVFLDEPTAALDPKSSDDFDQLIIRLRKLLKLTLILVTHDLDTLRHVPDRIVFLGEGKVLASGTMAELIKNKHPLIREYFSGPRGQQNYAISEAGEHG